MERVRGLSERTGAGRMGPELLSHNSLTNLKQNI